MLGVLLVGLVAGAVGGIVIALVPAPIRLITAALIAGLVLLREATGRPWRRWQNRRLVPPEIIPRGSVEGPLQFGFEMGTGMRTFAPSALPHLLLVLVVLVGGLGAGLVAGLGFALGRALVPWGRGLGDGPAWDARLRRSSAWLLRGSALAFVAALVASGALST